MEKTLNQVKEIVKKKGDSICPKCGVAFSCDIEKGKDSCWCFFQKAGKTIQNHQYTTCLCRACLTKQIEGESA
jgi:ribosomal protein L34E